MTDKNPSGRKAGLGKKRGPAKSQRRQIFEDAGFSRNQMYDVLAVGAIPKDEVEALIESDNPPSISELVRIGRGHDAHRKSNSRGISRLQRAWNEAPDIDRLALIKHIENKR